MKIYTVVEETTYDKTLLNSFTDIDDARDYMYKYGYNTLKECIGDEIEDVDSGTYTYNKTDNTVTVSYTGITNDSDELIDILNNKDVYNYSIEEQDIDKKYLVSIPVYVVTEEKRDSDRDYFFYVLKVFNEKYKAIEYRDKLIQETLDRYYGSKIDPNDENTVIYEESDGCINMDCYIKFEIKEHKIQ